MKKLGFRTILVLFAIMMAASSFAQVREQLKREIDKIIYHDTEIKLDQIPGYTVGIIIEDSIFIYHYGVAEKKVESPLNPNTIFELGGLSKVFTASLVEIMVREGLLDYQSSFNSFLDSVDHNPLFDHLNIEQLITHTSNMPKMPLEFGLKEKDPRNPYAYYTQKDLLDFYQRYRPNQKNKEKYYYSNVNYALLQIAIERACGMTYNQAVKEKLLAPLGLNDSGVLLSAEQKSRLVPGHNVAGFVTPAWRYQSFEASEGMKSTVNDLLQFLAVNLQLQSLDIAQQLAAIHVPTGETDMNKYAKVAKGWHVVKNRRYYDAIMHSGSTGGQRAYMGFVKESKTGVVVLSNSERGMNGLGFLILRLINNNWKKKRK